MALGRLLRPVIYVALITLPIAFCIWVVWSLSWMAEPISPSVAGLSGEDAPRGLVLARTLNEQRVVGSGSRDTSLFGDFKNDFWALIIVYCFWIVVNLIMSGLSSWMCFLEYKRNRVDNSTWFRNSMFCLVTIIVLTEIFVKVALPERLVRMNAATFLWLLIKDGLMVGFAFGWDFTIPSSSAKSKKATPPSRSNSSNSVQNPESRQMGAISRSASATSDMTLQSSSQDNLLKSPQANGRLAPGVVVGHHPSMHRNASRARSARSAKGMSSASFTSSTAGTTLTGNTLVLGPMHVNANGSVSPNAAPTSASATLSLGRHMQPHAHPPMPTSPMTPDYPCLTARFSLGITRLNRRPTHLSFGRQQPLRQQVQPLPLLLKLKTPFNSNFHHYHHLHHRPCPAMARRGHL
ncbi:hypothetical protein BCR44DRAFT_375094, partial [Catenaria anguillulae PL171]